MSPEEARCLPRWRAFGGVELGTGPGGACASSNPTLAVQSTWAGTSRHHAREKSEPTFQRPYQDELRTTIDVDRGYRQIDDGRGFTPSLRLRN